MPYGSSDDLNDAWEEIRPLKTKVSGLERELATANDTIRDLRSDKTKLEKTIERQGRDGPVRASMAFPDSPKAHPHR